MPLTLWEIPTSGVAKIPIQGQIVVGLPAMCMRILGSVFPVIPTLGKEVSYANAQAGDLICYNGHVAIYMGNGQIVHAKGTAYGIVAYDNATYRPIVTVRRVL